MSIKFINHAAEAQKAKDEAIARALEMIGLQAEGYAKEELSKPKPHADGSVRPNVDTGRLRNSITYATADSHSEGSFPAESSDYAVHSTPESDEVAIGTNVEYAPYIEEGTSRSSAYPYLRPAVQEHIEEYRRIVLDQLKGL